MNPTTLGEMIAGQKVHTVSTHETVRSACIQMTAANVGALPVVADNGELVGMLSERDVIQRSIIVYRPSETTIVKQVMTSNPQWLPPQASPDEAYRTMMNGRFRHLPICEEGKIIGIVSLRDFNPQGKTLVERLTGMPGKAVAARA